jgi:cell division protein FtsL
MERDDELVSHEDMENENDVMEAETDAADETETEEIYTETVSEISDEEPLPDDEAEAENTTASKPKRGLFRPVLFVIIVCFCVIAAVDMMSQSNEIEQLRQETVMMTNKIEETKQKNDEYTALLEADEDEFMERVAVEQLGYSYPNERRYYIVNKSDEQ